MTVSVPLHTEAADDSGLSRSQRNSSNRFRGRTSGALQLIVLTCVLVTQQCAAADPSEVLDGLAKARDYIARRASSYDRTGANRDYVEVEPGQTVTLIDAPGPGVVSHIWMTIASSDVHHLKACLLYTSPSPRD